MRALETRIPPPVVLLAIGIAMALLAGPAGTRPPAAWLALAGVLLVAGMAVNAAGFRAIRRAGSTIDPIHPDAASVLVSHGVFRFSRNPMYVGFTLMLAAWAAWLPSAAAWLGPLLFVAYVDRFQIRPEERALTARFGAAYTAYAAQVRRWL